MPKLSKSLSAALAGQAGAGEYIDDLFSTYLYDGTAASHTITNGINLADEGGLIWTKQRGVGSHNLNDTERGVGKYLTTNNTAAEGSDSLQVTAYNTDGYTLGADTSQGTVNYTYSTGYASWTFRKAPGFFDVVTYTGVDQGTPRRISHNLGCEPGMIIVKRTDDTSDWYVWHKSLSSNTHDRYLKLQDTGAESYSADFWGTSDPTSTDFGVKTFNNITGGTYVAYLFADGDDAAAQIFGTNGDQAVVKCGSFTTDGSGDATIDCGFEPQFVLAKMSSDADSWLIFDNMRGVVTGGNDALLLANASNAETSTADGITFNANGFFCDGGFGRTAAAKTFIYIAIRRPHKPAESGTEVFEASLRTGTGSVPVSIATNFAPDVWMLPRRNSSSFGTYVESRLSGFDEWLETNSTAGPALTWTAGTGPKMRNDEVYVSVQDNSVNQSGGTYVDYMFKRSPGFFDVVCYTGNSASYLTPTNISHNLGVAPEMMIIKCRSFAEDWAVYHKDLGTLKYLSLNSTAAAATDTGHHWVDTAPTDSVFTIGHQDDVNSSGNTHIAYLFASQDGISKVGSFTYNGTTSVDVDCGFTNGARFVLIKRTDGAGSWIVWDTERGIVAGDDPFLRLESTSAETTGYDGIDPLSSGFTLNTIFGSSPQTFIFLAIA